MIEKKKISQGIAWNICSYFFLGISTVIIYILIVYQYGQVQLGSYNIVLSIYMLLGQIGSWGLQSASIYYIPRLTENRHELSSCLFSFVLVALGAGTLLSIGIYIFSDMIGTVIFHARYVGEGMKRVAPSIALFSANKVICSFINGFKRMRVFAILQTARYAVITICVGTVVVKNLEFENVFYSFIISECAVLTLAVLVLVPYVEVALPKCKYLIHGFFFGAKAMFGNVVGDINTRIDTMMLGIFCGENIVGLYSFVTVISEGFVSLLYVFRNSYNPVFAALLHEKQTEQVDKEYHSLQRKLPIFFAGVSCLVVIVYVAFCMLFLDAAYMRSVHAIIYIAIAYVVMAPFFACGNLCTLKGYPLVDTMVMCITVVYNVALNIIFIPMFDIVGAAIATALANIGYVILMRICIRKFALKNTEIMWNDEEE